MDDIKVSIVVPVYNSERYINHCLDSIISQDFDNLDIIIIDDGSTDNSFAVCKDYKNRDCRVKLFKQQNKGVSAARNKGINEAIGEYIVFIDSDDYIESNFISSLLKLLINESVDLVITNYKIINTATGITEYNAKKESKLVSTYSFFYDYWKNYHLGYVNAPWNKIFKMSIIKDNNLRFPTDISMGEDGYFNVKYLHYCKNIYIYEEYLYNFRIHPTQSTKKIFKNHFYMMDKIFDNIEIELRRYKLLESESFKEIHYVEYLNELKLSLYYLFKDNTIKLRKKMILLKSICEEKRTQIMLNTVKGKNFKDMLLLFLIKIIS